MARDLIVLALIFALLLVSITFFQPAGLVRRSYAQIIPTDPPTTIAPTAPPSGDVASSPNASFGGAQTGYKAKKDAGGTSQTPGDKAASLTTGSSDNRSVLGLAPGALIPVPGAANSCSSAGGVVYDPQGRYLLIIDGSLNRVCSYSIDPQSRALTSVPGSPFSTGGKSSDRLAMDPSGQFVFVTNIESNNVSVFSFHLDTGALTPVPGSPFATGTQPLDVTTDGFGRYLYVANNLENSISAFSINRSSGALTPLAGSPFTMGNFLSRVAADPLGRFIYAVDSHGVFVLSIGTGGVLTAVAGSPLLLNPFPSAIAADPSGQYVFITQRANSTTNDTISAYRVGSQGTLTAVGSPVAIGELVGPIAIAVDPGGQRVYVANQSDNSTSGFSLDPSSGILTALPGSPFLAGESPYAVAAYSRLRTTDIAFPGTFFSEKVAVAGGTPPYSWSISAGSLPAGLALNTSTGIISGVPTSQGATKFPARIAAAASGTSPFTVKLVDSKGQTASQAFTIDLLSGNTPGAVATLPSSARAQGLNGAFYTTDVTASNLGGSSADLTFKFLGNNKDGSGGAEKTYTLAAGTTQTFTDVLGSVFGLTSDYGAINVSSPSFGVAVLSQTSTPGFGGTFGQSVPIATATALIQQGNPQSIIGIREDAAFRTNLILCNATGAPLDVDVTLVAENGSTLGTKRYTLPPLGMTQVTKVVRDVGVSANVKGARLVLSTPTNGGAFSAYASAIDNVTNDPRTLLPRTSLIPYDLPSRWYMPSSARAGGAGGAFYTTDLTMSNVGSKKASGFLKFLGNNKDGTSGETKSFSLAAGQSVTYTDVLKSLFGKDSDFGGIEIGAGEILDLVIVGQTSTPGFGGTFGQSVPAMANEDLVRYQSPRSIVAVREDSKFRTNLIMCNTVEFQSVDVDVTLIGPDGTVLGTKRYTLPPLGMTQVSRVALALGGTANLNGARLDLSVATQGGAVAAYASAIDNVTNDPRTLLPQ